MKIQGLGIFRFLLTIKTFLILGFLYFGIMNTEAQEIYKEKNRPLIHFSPKAHWINDPNGMVFYKGVYHLFFQYYPGATVWGPMHWGHAISQDLIHWEERPIALYPDSLGYIFSGSAVVDIHNTSGLGKDGESPLIALFTSHDPKGEKAGTLDFQNQSLAFSLDEGNTWIKYPGNPVLKNPGIKDFRDPKIHWFEPEKKWIMTLATMDRITFYSSPDLIHWNKESEFGENLGYHGGVWECPDLFSMNYKGKEIWVLIVNLNPGGPNLGSATQYFIGDFNGKDFTPFKLESKWLDFGPDEYAGITWANIPRRTIFLGWMSNWLYANQVPTEKWRNAMTLPRELDLEQIDGDYFIRSKPVEELSHIEMASFNLTKKVNGDHFTLPLNPNQRAIPCKIELEIKPNENFGFEVLNTKGEKTIIGWDKKRNAFFFDRRKSGMVDFQKDFPSISYSPRISHSDILNLTLVLDQSSMEFFGDQGLNVLTGIFFPNEPFSKIIFSGQGSDVKKLIFTPLKGIWN